jgi:hypothetical protein
MELEPLFTKAHHLKEKGFPIAVYSIEIEKYESEISRAKKIALELGVPFKLKSLLGEFENELHGQMKYPGAVASKVLKSCECKTSELLISPEGEVFRCHHDLYNKKFPTGDLTHENFQIQDKFKECHFYGNCNPCDIKVKNNRFQRHGHTSVTIKNIRDRNTEQAAESQWK